MQNSSGDGGRFVRRSSPLRSLVQPMRQKPLVDRDGFTLVESCRTQKQRRRLERSFGIQALETFKGWCFKCLSPHHRVALCCFIIRCLLCHTSGHTSYACPRRHPPYRQEPSLPPVCSRMAGRLSAPVHRLPPVHAAQCSAEMQGGHSQMRAVVEGIVWSPTLVLTLVAVSAQRSHILIEATDHGFLLGSSYGLQVSTRGQMCLHVPLFSM